MIRPRRHPFFVALLSTFALVAACKKPQDSSGSTASSSSSESAGSAAGPTLAGPCGDLQQKVCTAAGADSSLCSSAGEAYAVLSDAACNAALKDVKATETKIKDSRKSCLDLVEKLCAGLGQDSDNCKMVTEKTKQFPKERCDAMLPQVDAIVSDLKREEERREAASKPLSVDLQASIAASDAPSFGPADAKVTIVEFSDFQCPFCSRAADVTHKIREKYGDKVRFVFRHFPLSFHENAGPAAEASMAAHAQGKFWEYHDKLFANQQSLDGASLEGYAKEAGLDLTKFKASLASKEYGDEVKADVQLGEKVVVEGTPTMFVNGERVPNPTDFGSVSQLIEKLLGS